MNKKYKIVILTSPHPKKAAGILAFDIMNVFRKNGHDAIIVTKVYLDKKENGIYSLSTHFKEFITKKYGLIEKKLAFFKKTNPDYCMYGLNQNKHNNLYKKILKRIPFKPDVFIYLFPQNFLNAKDLYFLNKKTGAPVFWYMMDMAPMTGGCHYAWNCIGYTNECGTCPGIFSTSKSDQTFKNLMFKKRYIEKTQILPISGSEWQYQQLLSSALFKNKKKYKVLLPIDTNIFKSGNKTENRLILGIPNDKRILFFGAVIVTNRRKGFEELGNALSILRNALGKNREKEIFVVVAGKHSEEMEKLIPFEHKYLGYLDYQTLAKAYNAADVFICPSIEDSGPMMINQSIISGTPVVAFKMGVAMDLVKSGTTGYLANRFDCTELAEGIKKILDLNPDEYKQMSNNCEQLGIEQCSFESFAKNINQIVNDNQL